MLSLAGPGFATISLKDMHKRNERLAMLQHTATICIRAQYYMSVTKVLVGA